MTCIIEKTESGYFAYIEELPGCARTAPTLDGVAHLMREAVSAYFVRHLDAVPLLFRSSDKWFTVDAATPVAAPLSGLGSSSDGRDLNSTSKASVTL